MTQQGTEQREAVESGGEPVCQHPNGRMRYGVVDEFEKKAAGLVTFPLLYGFCCNCGEVVEERRLRRPRKVA